MRNRKLWSTLTAVFVLALSIMGVLILGTSAAGDVIEYKINGVQFSSVKAALSAAENEEWPKGTSLVIAVDPSAVANESISHDAPTTSGLTTLYSTAQQDTAYLEKITAGDFVCGFARIKMAIGETKMGGHTDFAGKKLVFSVGDVFHTYLAETRMYRVNVITDQGVVFTTVIDGTKNTSFSFDADEDAKFYCIEVLDEEIENQPIIAIGNPIWND